MFICSSSIFACLSRAANLFCNVVKDNTKVNPLRALLPLPRPAARRSGEKGKYFRLVYVFSIFLTFFSIPFRKDRKISFEGENNKKETKIEHGKSCWERLLYITSHTAFYRPMPTRKTVIELAEGKIGFFGYRNHTKPVRRERAGHSVAFFFCCRT